MMTNVVSESRFSRFTIPPVLAVLMTAVLFYLMQYLISNSDVKMELSAPTIPMTLFRVKKTIELETTKPKAVPPVNPEIPPVTEKPSFKVGPIVTTQTEITKLKPVLKRGVPIYSDGGELPLVKVAPKYPSRALTAGLEGWVVVEFDVNERGGVEAPRIADHCAATKLESATSCKGSPNRVFDKEALRAVSKFKYRPKVVDGKPMLKSGVRNKLIFQLAK